jgi:hypothetical protein
VDVNVDKTGGGDEALGVDFSGLLEGGGGGAGDEDAVVDKKFAGGFVALGGGVDDTGVGVGGWPRKTREGTKRA